tara:strand:+ start:4556 stop:4981 length:426 start_codon:yes stop_codon:yes gene_type:complete
MAFHAHYMSTTVTTLDKWDVTIMMSEKNAFAPSNMCHNSCARIINMFPKNQRDQITLVEGKADMGLHYWLEVDGEIIDAHYDIIGTDSKIHVAEKKFKGSSVSFEKGSDNFWEQWGTFDDGSEGSRRVRHVDVDRLVEITE